MPSTLRSSARHLEKMSRISVKAPVRTVDRSSFLRRSSPATTSFGRCHVDGTRPSDRVFAGRTIYLHKPIRKFICKLGRCRAPRRVPAPGTSDGPDEIFDLRLPSAERANFLRQTWRPWRRLRSSLMYTRRNRSINYFAILVPVRHGLQNQTCGESNNLRMWKS